MGTTESDIFYKKAEDQLPDKGPLGWQVLHVEGVPNLILINDGNQDPDEAREHNQAVNE